MLFRSAARIWVGGLLVALVFAIGLFALERNNQIGSAQRDEERRIERDAYYERLRDPAVQRGFEAYQQIQAQREQRDADANTE